MKYTDKIIDLFKEYCKKNNKIEIYGLCGSCFKDCVKITGLI